MTTLICKKILPELNAKLQPQVLTRREHIHLRVSHYEPVGNARALDYMHGVTLLGHFFGSRVPSLRHVAALNLGISGVIGCGGLLKSLIYSCALLPFWGVQKRKTCFVGLLAAISEVSRSSGSSGVAIQDAGGGGSHIVRLLASAHKPPSERTTKTVCCFHPTGGAAIGKPSP